MPTTNMPGRFRPGHLVATPAVLEVVPRNELMNAFLDLPVHQPGDLGHPPGL